ncbi:hypothetical protein [Albidovulum sp.]|uniref:hypothetical protein n=1 Tax=Albidovulum sp. TaxID=1872424 RepID=UPI0039B8FB43
MAQEIIAQLSDPFRIALSIGLVLTMLRTEGVSGRWIPLLAGVVFIAVLIPMTMQAREGADRVVAIGAGLVSTGLLVAAALMLRALVLRAMGR